MMSEIRVGFYYMPARLVRDFVKLANGEFTLCDNDWGVDEVRIPCPAHFDPVLFDRDVFIEFRLKRHKSPLDLHYGAILDWDTVTPIVADERRGFRIFDRSNEDKRRGFRICDWSNNCHFYVVVTDETPTPEQAIELVNLCLELAKRSA